MKEGESEMETGEPLEGPDPELTGDGDRITFTCAEYGPD
jgi:hypothetical protein